LVVPEGSRTAPTITDDDIFDVLKQFVGHEGRLLAVDIEAKRAFERCRKARRCLSVLAFVLALWFLMLTLAVLLAALLYGHAFGPEQQAIARPERSILIVVGAVTGLLLLLFGIVYLLEWALEGQLQRVHDDQVEEVRTG